MATTAQRYAQASHGLAGAAYDADEEDERIGFEQDPEEDEGIGTWTMADGSTRYGPGDPAEARALGQKAAPVAPATTPAAPEPAPAPAEDEDDFEIISGLEEEPAAPAPAPAPVPASKQPEMQTLAQDVNAPKGEKQTLQQDFDAPKGEIVPLAAKTPPPAPAPPPAGAQPVTAPIDIPKSSRIASEHNNPGNLKYVGQAGAVRGEKAADGGYFARFETPEMGVAALRKQIDLDSSRGKTLEQWIGGYAPPGSNDTAGYVKKAANTLGVRPETPLSAIDPTRLTTFVAMQESSTRLSPEAAQAPAAGPGLARKTTASEQQTQSQQTGQSASVNVTRQGSAQPLEDFAAQQQRVAAGYEEAIRQAGTGTGEQVQAILNNRAALMQQAQDREAATTAAIAQRDARANQVKQKIQEVGSRKVDINRTWKNKGTLGTMLGLLGVALRSRNATKFGGPNTALQYLENERKQDIDAQMDDRNSELRGLERELGSLDAAVPMLEARMNDALAKRTQALLQDEKSATVLANGRDLIAKLNLERDQKLAESARAYWGTLSQQQALSAQQTGTRSMGTEFSDTAAPGEAKDESATAGPFPNIAEGTPEDDSVEERKGFASMFHAKDPAHMKQWSDYGKGQEKLATLKATRDTLRKYYGQPNEKGEYVKGDFGSTATGSAWHPAQWLPNDERDRELTDAWTKVEQATRMDWKTEPNGQEMQNRLGQVNIPKRDSDVPTKLQELDRQIAQLETGIDAETLVPVRAAYKLQKGSPYKAEKTGARDPSGRKIARQASGGEATR